MQKPIKAVLLLLSLIGFISLSCGPAQAYFIASHQIDVPVSTGDWQAPGVEVNLVRDNNSKTIRELITQPEFELKEGETQTFELANLSLPPYISFAYRLKSQETALGFDEPAFWVSFDQRIVFQDWLEPYLIDSPGQPIESDWRKIYLPIPDKINENENLTINFVVNNSGDNQYPTQLEVQNVTTQTVVLNQSDLVKVSTESDAQIHVGLIDEQNEVRHLTAEGSMTLSAQELSQIKHFQVWAVDPAGNTSQVFDSSVVIDVVPPASALELQTEHLSEPETVVSWKTAGETETNLFDCQFELFNLISPTADIFDQYVNFRLPHNLPAPKPPGIKDHLVLEWLPKGEYQFKLEIRDAALNQRWQTLDFTIE